MMTASVSADLGTGPARAIRQARRTGESAPMEQRNRLSGGPALPNVSHQGITIRLLVGPRLRLSWLKGDHA